MDAKPKCRRFRYSLRTLLLLVAVVSLPFGWLGYKMRQARQQQAAVEAIQKLNGSVTYDYERVPSKHPGGEAKVDLTAKPPGPAWVQKPPGKDALSNVVGVNLSCQHVTDEVFDYLIALPTLEWISIEDTQITDTGLAKLQGLTQLSSLYLRNTPITDVALVHLRAMTQLKSLDLVNTQITDEGFQGLQLAMPHLHIYRHP